MNQSIGAVTVLIADYDEAIAWYTSMLDFVLCEDRQLADGKRWVRIAPPGATGTSMLLAVAATEAQRTRIGDQTGGRVGFFLHTDDFARDYAAMAARGVRFVEPPRKEVYGDVAVFTDLYGNRWDLLELPA
ncbi:MAG: VOC family protein [Pseudomonadota bacterium]|nr:VOC family protein [Pseudomonadota bacterium]